MLNSANSLGYTSGDATSSAIRGTPAWRFLSAVLFVALSIDFLAPARVEALRLYRGHPWCERPVISGAARGRGYNYNSTPPHTVANHPRLSRDALQFLLHQANPDGGFAPSSGRRDWYEMQAIMDYHRQGYTNSGQSPLISTTTSRGVAEGYAQEIRDYTDPNFPGEVLVIDVPDTYVCPRDRWQRLIELEVERTGHRLLDPAHRIFTTCHVFQFADRDTRQWVFVHEIPNRYITSSYPFPRDLGDEFPRECGDEPQIVDGDDTPPSDGDHASQGRRGRQRLRGRSAQARSKAGSRPGSQSTVLNLGGTNVNLTTLQTTVVAYLTRQFQASLKAQVEEVRGEFVAQAQGYAQELYQDFLYWLNGKVHAELGSQFSIDSQAFEQEFLAWINSPRSQLSAYVEAYVKERSATVGWLIEAYRDQESREIVGGLKGIWQDAKGKYDRFTRATEDIARTPDTPHADTLKKYGFSGPWIDQFQSYEGEFNAFDERYQIVEASQIVVGAFQSDVPRDKIDALFQLLELMGSVAEESNIPIVSFFGQIVRIYGEVANAMLAQIDGLAEQLRARQGYCIGVGTTADERNDAFTNAFGAGSLICPTLISQDIYERVEPPDGRIYFWVKDKFIAGQELGGGLSGVRQAMDLIAAAGESGLHKYRGKKDDVATIAEFYNTPYKNEQYGHGLLGLVKEADATIGGIAGRLGALEQGVSTVGEAACSIQNLHTYLSQTVGLNLTSFSAPLGEESPSSFSETTQQLKVLFAVSYIEKRRGAYQTYSDIWTKLQPLSLLRFEGAVRKSDSPRALCPDCRRAAIELALNQAHELTGCEIQAADIYGNFTAHILTTSDDFSVGMSAKVKDKQSPSLNIDKQIIQVSALPFVKIWFDNLLVPIEAGEETDPPGPDESQVLADANDSLESLQAAANSAAATANEATALCQSAQQQGQEAEGQVATLTSGVATFQDKATALKTSLSTIDQQTREAKDLATDAYQAAEVVAQVRDTLQDLALGACQKTESLTQTGSATNQNRLLAEIRTADSQAGALRQRASEAVTRAKNDAQQARGLKESMQTALANAKNIGGELKTVESQLSSSRSALGKVRATIAQAKQKIARLDQIQAEAAQLLATGQTKLDPVKDTPDGQRLLEKMETLYGQVVAEKSRVASCPDNVVEALGPLEQKIASAETALNNAKAAIGPVVAAGSNTSPTGDIDSAVAEVQASADTAEVFMVAVEARAADAAQCVALARGNAVISVAVSPANVSLELDASQDLSATATFADGSQRDVTAEAEWSPGATFTASQAGVFTITARYRGASGSATLTVQEPDDPSYTQAKGLIQACEISKAERLLDQIVFQAHRDEIQAAIAQEATARSLHNQAMALARQGQYEQALSILEQAQQSTQRPACKAKIGNRIASIRSKTIAQPGQDGDPAYEQAKGLVQACEIAKAERLLDQIVFQAHRDEVRAAIAQEATARSLHNQALALARQGQYQQALSILEQAQQSTQRPACKAKIGGRIAQVRDSLIAQKERDIAEKEADLNRRIAEQNRPTPPPPVRQTNQTRGGREGGNNASSAAECNKNYDSIRQMAGQGSTGKAFASAAAALAIAAGCDSGRVNQALTGSGWTWGGGYTGGGSGECYWKPGVGVGVFGQGAGGGWECTCRIVNGLCGGKPAPDYEPAPTASSSGQGSGWTQTRPRQPADPCFSRYRYLNKWNPTPTCECRGYKWTGLGCVPDGSAGGIVPGFGPGSGQASGGGSSGGGGRYCRPPSLSELSRGQTELICD